jgi:hypothetical protein
MTFPFSTMTLRVASTLICTISLVACGGGGGSTSGNDSVTAALVVAKPVATSSIPASIKPVTITGTDPLTGGTPVVTIITPTTGSAGGTPVAPVVTPTGTLAVITDVRLQNTGATVQNLVPVTFGQIFAVGAVKPTDVVVGRLEDNTLVPLQMDVKATHADGTVRHAIFSAIIPTLAGNATRTMSLAKNATVTAGVAPTPADLLAAGFTASASATIAGVKYSASADQLMKAGVKNTWLAGAVANEWQVSAPLTTSSGVAHPQLTARFAIRYYGTIKKARVDVTIENNWAFEAGPQNYTYDAEVTVAGKSVFTKTNLTHLTQARWRKLFWWGGDAPPVNTMLNTSYLIASRAVPNYDPAVTIGASTLATLGNASNGGTIAPMSIGIATAYMPTTGAHDDIGILPGWSTSYLLTGDKRARDATLFAGDGAGSFSMHYRDKVTDRPVSLSNYPYMTLVGRSTDTYNPVAKRYEAFPGCSGDCSSPYTHDIPHQPSLAYLPYLVTGDYYYLEEMQFWAMYDTFASNPGYRGYGAGLVIPEQLRGQAWALRTLAQAAYITPDADVLKTDLVTLMNNNLDWYNNTYTTNASANKLGVPINGYAVGYNNETAVAPWMDDFFTSAVGHAAELGFTKAKSLLAWKAKFPVGRMTAPGVCWITGAPYNLTIRDSSSSPVYDTLAQAYTHDLGAPFMALPCAGTAMAAAWGAVATYGGNIATGDMANISNGTMGYPSNMQPALAYSVDSGIANSKTAWSLFMGRTVKPDYSLGAQFAIVPR